MTRPPSRAAALARTKVSSSQWAAMGRQVWAKIFQRLLFIDQQVTGGRPDENLDTARSCFFTEPRGVLPGRSPEEPIVHHTRPLRAGQLGGEGVRGGGGGRGVGHLHECRHAPFCGRHGSGAKVLLVRETGLTKMNLIVNQPREDVHARCIDDVIRVDRGRRIKIGTCRLQSECSAGSRHQGEHSGHHESGVWTYLLMLRESVQSPFRASHPCAEPQGN